MRDDPIAAASTTRLSTIRERHAEAAPRKREAGTASGRIAIGKYVILVRQSSAASSVMANQRAGVRVSSVKHARATRAINRNAMPFVSASDDMEARRWVLIGVNAMSTTSHRYDGNRRTAAIMRAMLATRFTNRPR